MSPPPAHIGGWPWIAYLLPVLIVVVPLLKNLLDARKQKKTAARKATRGRK